VVAGLQQPPFFDTTAELNCLLKTVFKKVILKLDKRSFYHYLSNLKIIREFEL